MTYSYRIYRHIVLCPAEDWNHVCRGGDADVFMNQRFLSVVEKAFFPESSFWHVLFYNEDGEPMACASLCTFEVDVVALAGSSIKRIIQLGRRLFPTLAKIRMLLCGLPVSSGQHHLVMRREADQEQILQMLDRILSGLAKEQKARLIVFKEFGAAACKEMESLASAGYQVADSPAGNLFRADFSGFDDYCAALNSHYRSDIRRSQRKFERAGLVAIHVRDREEILRLYDGRLHDLYESVVEKSDVRLEILPLRFFQELVQHFPRQVSLTVILKDNRVIAFNWGLHDGPMFYFLFCGMDYAAQDDADLYFNLMFHQLDYALRCGPAWISFGQTADFFKSRLGCQPQPLYFFVKGVGPTMSRLIRHGSELLFPKRAGGSPHSIFRMKPGPPPSRASNITAAKIRKNEARVMEES